MAGFELNPAAQLRTRSIAPGLDCVVVDDFLADPGALRAWARSHRDDFSYEEGSYPGETLSVPAECLEAVYAFIRNRMSRQFGFLRGDLRLSALMSLTTQPPETFNVLQRLPHTDPGAEAGRANFAALVYLFDDPALGGTGFYEFTDRDLIASATRRFARSPEAAERLLALRFPEFNEAPRYVTGSTSFARLLASIPAKFNRLVFYSGDIPHSAMIEDARRLTTVVDTGRLTLNVFASVVPAR